MSRRVQVSSGTVALASVRDSHAQKFPALEADAVAAAVAVAVVVSAAAAAAAAVVVVAVAADDDVDSEPVLGLVRAVAVAVDCVASCDHLLGVEST